jgi:hypothetical protein
LASALAKAGQWDRAERVAGSITESWRRPWALSAIAHARVNALAEAGQWDRAERVARSITNPSDQIDALLTLARALADIDRDRALTLAADAEQAARRITTGPNVQVRALLTLARTLFGIDRDRALTVAADAEQAARSTPRNYYPGAGPALLTVVATALAEAGQWDHAERVARSITDPADQAEALAMVAKALADIDLDRALTLAAGAEQAARSITDYSRQLAVVGMLGDIDLDGALALAADAERALRNSSESPYVQTGGPIEVAMILAKAGQCDSAEQAARIITYPPQLSERERERAQADAYVSFATALLAASLKDRTRASESLRSCARRFLAQALSGGSWVEAIRLLGKLDPSGVTSIYEAFYSPDSGT